MLRVKFGLTRLEELPQALIYYIVLLVKLPFNSLSVHVVFNALYSTQDNVLVAAPTGSGKTICAEFAVLKLFSDMPETAKAVYVTPYPSLAKQVSNSSILLVRALHHNCINLEFMEPLSAYRCIVNGRKALVNNLARMLSY